MTAIIRLFALGAIMVVWSEFWFYPVSIQPDSWIVLPFYAFSTAIVVYFLARFPATGWPGIIVVSGLMGLAIEGVAVPVIYEAPPFSLMWTSLAWHALISFFFGIVAMRWLMARPLTQMVPTLLFAGFLLGIWGGYFWSFSEDTPGGPYWAQLWGGFIVVVIGHLMLDAVHDRPMPPSRVGEWATAVLVLGLWAVAWALPLFPVSLIFPAFCGLTLWCFVRSGPRPDRTAAIWGTRIPLARYPFMVLLPASAMAGYTLSYAQPWEVNAWWILVTGTASVLPWLWAHAAMLRGKGA